MRKSSILYFIIFLMMIGCKKDETPTNTNDNGSNNNGISPSTITATVEGQIFKISQISPTFSSAAYDPSSGNTIINITDGIKSLSLWFHGSTTGTYQFFENQQNDNLQRTSVSLVVNLQQMYLSLSNKGTVTVTKYEAPSGRISGRFTGTFFNTMTKEEIIISDGEFSVTRTI